MRNSGARVAAGHNADSLEIPALAGKATTMARRLMNAASSRLQNAASFGAMVVVLLSGYAMAIAFAQQSAPAPTQDAVTNAQRPSPTEETRPEQRKSDHDRSDVFNPQSADPASPDATR